MFRDKKLPRFKSEYFNYDMEKHLIQPKFRYRIISDFRGKFTKQFKRGIYKIFLEERSESRGDALDPQFDFIREFARYGIGDYPVYYCRPTTPAIFFSLPDVMEPVIRFTDHSDRVMQEFGFYSYYFISHTITFPTIRTYELTLDNYVRYFLKSDDSQFDKMIPLKSITDIDFIFSFAN
jgi:hypothetical protein